FAYCVSRGTELGATAVCCSLITPRCDRSCPIGLCQCVIYVGRVNENNIASVRTLRTGVFAQRPNSTKRWHKSRLNSVSRGRVRRATYCLLACFITDHFLYFTFATVYLALPIIESQLILARS